MVVAVFLFAVLFLLAVCGALCCVLCGAVLRWPSVPRSAVWCGAVLRVVVWCCLALLRVVVWCAVLLFAVLSCAVLVWADSVRVLLVSGPRFRQRPARRTYRQQRTAGRCPSGTTPHQPDRRHGRQNRHLPAARPPAQTPARIRQALPPRRTPRSPRTRGAYPSRHPWREATPGGHRHRQTMAPNRLHRRPNRSATRPRCARKDCRDPRNERRHQHQWGNLAGEQTSNQCGVPT